MAKKNKPSLENTFEQLEDIVERLSDDIPLEESLTAFEQGIKLVAEAQKTLEEAEQKIALLTETEDGEIVEEEFDDIGVCHTLLRCRLSKAT